MAAGLATGGVGAESGAAAGAAECGGACATGEGSAGRALATETEPELLPSPALGRELQMPQAEEAGAGEAGAPAGWDGEAGVVAEEEQAAAETRGVTQLAEEGFVAGNLGGGSSVVAAMVDPLDGVVATAAAAC